MNEHIVFGLFALYVAAISLWLVLVGWQDALLEQLRRFWGRTLGHSLYFLARVAIPMLICVFCLGWGVRQYDAKIAFSHFKTPVQLNVEYYRDFRLMLQEEQVPDTLGEVYGA